MSDTPFTQETNQPEKPAADAVLDETRQAPADDVLDEDRQETEGDTPDEDRQDTEGAAAAEAAEEPASEQDEGEQPASFSGFLHYKQTVTDLITDLKKLREFSERLNLEGNTGAIDEILERLAGDTFSVAIVGEFKRGKSTVINALLGKSILPVDVLPTTATLNRITYSVTPFVKIEYKDGREEQIEIDQLENYVTKLTRESEEVARTVREAVVYYPINYCKNGVTIIDTPGLNDDAAMTEVTMSVLPQIDAALMVIMAQAPFSESERDFLESKIITSDLGRVLFVVTGIDLLDEEDVDRVLDSIRTRIQEHVLKKAEDTFGADSKEYETYRQKLGNIQLYGLSAKQALKAKTKGDPELLERSCFPAFENALEKFLSEDRGAVTLSAPVSRIKTSSLEIVKAIQLRQSSLEMAAEEFEEKYTEALQEIERIREERTREFATVNANAQKTFDELTPMLRDYWPSVEKAAMDAVDRFPLSSADLKKQQMEATTAALTEAVKNAVARTGQKLSERIQAFINSALENEADRLSGFEADFFSSTQKIQNIFVTKDSSLVLDSVLGTAGNYFIPGIGGVYVGYKEAGWKGALLGGAVSLVGSSAAAFGLGALIPVLSIPVTWPALIIAAIAGGAIGLFGSKWAVGKAFANDKIEKFRNNFKEAVSKELATLRSQDNITGLVRDQINSAFDALKAKINTETENILNDTQNQLTQIRVQMAQKETDDARTQEEYEAMLKAVDAICLRAEALGRQLTEILTR